MTYDVAWSPNCIDLRCYGISSSPPPFLFPLLFLILPSSQLCLLEWCPIPAFQRIHHAAASATWIPSYHRLSALLLHPPSPSPLPSLIHIIQTTQDSQMPQTSWSWWTTTWGARSSVRALQAPTHLRTSSLKASPTSPNSAFQPTNSFLGILFLFLFLSFPFHSLFSSFAPCPVTLTNLYFFILFISIFLIQVTVVWVWYPFSFLLSFFNFFLFYKFSFSPLPLVFFPFFLFDYG